MAYVFESENVAVRSVPTARTDRWVVTFDNHGIGHGFDRPGFSEAFLEAEGVSALHVLGRREDWYQYPEMAEAMAVVRNAVSGADRVLTYGSSMGGYAAIRFADAAGASAVLALSPQYSIDPLKASFESRWPHDARRIRWLPEVDGPISCAAVPVVVYDPMSDDARHIDLIRGDIRVSEISVPHIGHPATTVLAELSLLRPLLLECLAGTIDTGTYAARVRTHRRESSVYLALLAEAQPSHRLRMAVALARRALEIAPATPIAMATLGHLLTIAGESEEAVSLLRAADLCCSSANLHIAVRLSLALSAHGRLDDAYAVARRITSLHPHLVNPRSLKRRILRVASSGPATPASRLGGEAVKLWLEKAVWLVARRLQQRPHEARLRSKPRFTASRPRG